MNNDDLTKRELFTLFAMQGFLANSVIAEQSRKTDMGKWVTENSIKCADHVLKALAESSE